MDSLGNILISCFIIFGGGFAWILGLGQLFLEYRSKNNYLLAGFFFLLGIWQMLGGMVYLGLAKHFPFNIFVISVPAYYTSLPLLYFYFQGILDSQYHITPRHLSHFILPGISLILLFPSSFTPVNLYQVMNFFEHTQYNTNEIVVSVVMYSANFVYLAYLLKIIRDVRDLLKKASSGQKRTIRILLIAARFMILLNIFWFVDRMFSMGISQITYAFVSISLIGIYLISGRYPEFLLIVELEAEVLRYTKSQIDHIDSDAVIYKINKFMQREKAFLTDNINLKDLAKEIDISPHQLSEILNRKLNKSFNLLINEYRINEAKEILLREPERKILAVAFDVGFNSPSAFYKAFQKFVGMTPTRFRQNENK